MTFDIDDNTVEVRVDFLCKNKGSLFDNLESLKRVMKTVDCEIFIIQSIKYKNETLTHDGSGSYVKQSDNDL